MCAVDFIKVDNKIETHALKPRGLSALVFMQVLDYASMGIS